MPQVQVYNGPQVSENMPAQNRVSGSPGGVIGDAQERQAALANTLGKMVGAGAELITKIEDKKAQELVTPALVQLQTAARNNKLRMQTEEVLDKAKDLRPKHEQWFDEQMTKIGGALGNERARQYFDAKSQELRDRYLGEVDAHEFGEKTKAKEIAAKSQVALLVDSAVGATTAEAQSGAIADLDRFLTTQANDKGLTDPAAVAQAKRPVFEALVKQIAGGYVKAGRGEEAKAFIEQQAAAGRLGEAEKSGLLHEVGKEIANNDGVDAAVKTGTLAGALRVVREKYKEGSDEERAAVNGAKSKLAEIEALRNDAIERKVTELTAYAYRNGGIGSITDKQLDDLARLGGKAASQALSWKETRDRERENKMKNGTRFAMDDDENKFYEVASKLSAHEITTPEQLQQYAGFFTKGTYNGFERDLREKTYPDVKVVAAEYERLTGKKVEDDLGRFNRVFSAVRAAQTGNAAVDVHAVVRGEVTKQVIDWGSDKPRVDMSPGERKQRFRPEAAKDFGGKVENARPVLSQLLGAFSKMYRDDAAALRAKPGEQDPVALRMANDNVKASLHAASRIATAVEDPQAFYERYGYAYENWAYNKMSLGGFPVDDKMMAVYAVLTEIDKVEPTTERALAVYRMLSENQ